MDWLFAPIDPTRAHEVGMATAWHARTMVLAWGVLAPLAVLVARFFKILPSQDWPNELDNQFWWRSHWMGQLGVAALSLIGVSLVLPLDLDAPSLHNVLGGVLLLLLVTQVLLGALRGSKGGPQAAGHHYDMTAWRHAFEAMHKSLGYAALILSVAVIVSGLWKANAPVWMWALLAIWWAGLIVAFAVMQRKGMAVDTYQAIWGADPAHPGNRLPAPGWAVRRPGDTTQEGPNDVRSDRGDGLRSH